VRNKSSLALMASLLGVQPALAQPAIGQPAEPKPQMIAQAYDRCMTTYAVRLTKTPATDEDIYAQARQSCSAIDDRLSSAIRAQLPPAQASEILASIAAQGKPGFMSRLTRIRTDRARSADPR
jgi:hypothetical protein